MILIHDKLSRLSNAFATTDQAVISLLDEYYEKVKLWYSYAIENYFNVEEILKGPLSMQGDYAVLIKTNGKEGHIKPKFKNHFTLSEFSKLLNSPFAYTTIANLAIYYSRAKGLEYNKEASHRYGINLLGDVIVLPQDLMP